MKKILQINVVSNSGSTGRIMEDIGSHIIKQGWESYVGYGRFSNKSSSEEIKIGNVLDIYGHVLQSRLFDIQGFGSRNATKIFVEKLKQIKPDLIHLHNIHGYYLNIPQLINYINSNNLPVIWTLHDCWAFTGHCAHFDLVDCNKWKTHCFKCPQKNSYPASFWCDNSYNNFKNKKRIFSSIQNLNIVPVSNWLEGKVSESFLGSFNRRKIYNGIDLNIFSPKILNCFRNKYEIEGKFMILGVANIWSNSKGLFDFLELSKKISNDEIIVLVGLTKKQINSLPKNIIGLERTQSTEELAEIYSNADVFVNPTMLESLGMTNIEAQACGTPVVTYNSGGCSETVNEYTGYVIERGDIESLWSGIAKIKSNGKEKYKDACVKWVKNNFNENKTYMEYINLYKSILSLI